MPAARPSSRCLSGWQGCCPALHRSAPCTSGSGQPAGDQPAEARRWQLHRPPARQQSSWKRASADVRSGQGISSTAAHGYSGHDLLHCAKLKRSCCGQDTPADRSCRRGRPPPVPRAVRLRPGPASPAAAPAAGSVPAPPQRPADVPPVDDTEFVIAEAPMPFANQQPLDHQSGTL